MMLASRIAVVVDDSSGIRCLLTRMLALEGFEVLACGTGGECLATIAAHTVTLATVDLVLPDTSGAELVPRIVELSPETNILVVTGNATSTFVDRVLRAGAFDVLFKPFDRKMLQDSLRRVGLASSS